MGKSKPGQGQEKNRTVSSGANSKKPSSRTSWGAFANQLAALQLFVRDVGADGNCLFRALSDQLEGSQAHHVRIRDEVVTYMAANPDDFAPFAAIEATDFSSYCSRMRRDGVWGGHLELVAASRCFSVLVIVHQLEAPRLEVHPLLPPRRTIQLSYHNGEHYASVRRVGDDTTRPAAETALPSSATVPASGSGSKSSGASAAAAARARQRDADGGVDLSRAERICREETGCRNIPLIREALSDMWSDVASTVEYLIAMREAGDAAFFVDDDGSIARDSSAPSTAAASSAPAHAEPASSNPTASDLCSCGSGKRTKKCCTKRLKVAARMAAEEEKLAERSRKDARRKELSKSASATAAPAPRTTSAATTDAPPLSPTAVLAADYGAIAI
jgi:OTU domain-containing protein 3